MKVDVIMPQMGESIAEATISKWIKKVGDKISKDETILEISTDKVDSEIPAPSAGVIVELLFKEGDVVPVKTKIAVIDTDASTTASSSPAPGATPPTAKPEASVQQQSPSAASSNCDTANGQAGKISSHDSDSGSGKFFSPLVKSLAEKHGVNFSELDQISGSGQGGASD